MAIPSQMVNLASNSNYLPLCAEVITGDPANNVTDNIYEKMGVNLHMKPAHPIGIIKDAIYSYFDRTYPGVFTKFDDLHPIVSARAVSSDKCFYVLPMFFWDEY